MARRADDPASFLPLRPTDLQVLLVLAEGPLHAYGISRRSFETEAVRLEIGSLYRIVHRLRTLGLIEEVAAGEERGEQGQRKRRWQISGLGHAVLVAELRRLRRVVASPAARRLSTESGE